jgi:hypothetical protein
MIRRTSVNKPTTVDTLHLFRRPSLPRLGAVGYWRPAWRARSGFGEDDGVRGRTLRPEAHVLQRALAPLRNARATDYLATPPTVAALD